MRFKKEEPMEGFPLLARERKALDEFLGEAAPCPSGVAGVTLTNLHSRHWIDRAGTSDDPKDYAAPLYSTTASGRLAIEIDDYFINAGHQRPGRPPGASAYKNLSEKWHQFKISD